MHGCITAHCADHRACTHLLVCAYATAPSRCGSADKFVCSGAALEPNGWWGVGRGAGAARWQFVWEDLILTFYWALSKNNLILYERRPLAPSARSPAPPR